MSVDPYNRNNAGKFGPGNPGGRGKRHVISRDAVDRIFNKLAPLSIKDLKKFASDENENILEGMIAKVMLKAYVDGDAGRLTMLLDRAVGKVKEIQDININPEAEVLEGVPTDELLRIIKSA